MNTEALKKLSLCIGSGGVRAYYGGMATATVALIAEIDFEHIGGVSGGCIVAAPLAQGIPVPELNGIGFDMPIDRFLIRKANKVNVLWALLMKYRYEITRPLHGVYCAEGIRKFIDKLVPPPTWPKKFWTIAVDGLSQIIFTADGIYRCETDGCCVKQPWSLPSVGLAVSASIAVPGILPGVPFEGRVLYDGAIGYDGQTPVGVVERHFRWPRNRIVAVDIKEDSIKDRRFLRWLWRVLGGPNCGAIDGIHPDRSGDLILVELPPTSFHGLQFDLSPAMKWEGFIKGFMAAATEFERAGLVSGVKLGKIQEIAEEFRALEARPLDAETYARRAEQSLCTRGLIVHAHN